ncbi:MAG TPA: methylmalonyl Co-A mutase-associated GTPase MeaB [Chitinophagaceae bacterium]
MFPVSPTDLSSGDARSLARAITCVENALEGYEDLLINLPGDNHAVIIGVTGPPGAGKSSLADRLIGAFVKKGKKVAVLCVDPSSPFNLGAVLGDRIRMSEWYNHPAVFIRSLATRGALGGLTPTIIEITEIVKAANFDVIIIETVGVGQSEIEIASLADVTMVVLVPESGDEIQTMKAGLMEIADIFVINKADRPGAELFERNLRLMLAPVYKNGGQPPVIKTVATENKGVDELVTAISDIISGQRKKSRVELFIEKAWQLLVQKQMGRYSKSDLREQLQAKMREPNFNLYRFVEEFYHQ